MKGHTVDKLDLQVYNITRGMCGKPTPLDVGWKAHLFHISMCMQLLNVTANSTIIIC